MAAVEAAGGDGEVERVERDGEHIDQLALPGSGLGDVGEPRRAAEFVGSRAARIRPWRRARRRACRARAKCRSRPEISSARRVSRPGADEQEGLTVRESAPCLDEDAESGRVDERHLREVDDQPLR